MAGAWIEFTDVRLWDDYEVYISFRVAVTFRGALDWDLDEIELPVISKSCSAFPTQDYGVARRDHPLWAPCAAHVATEDGQREIRRSIAWEIEQAGGEAECFSQAAE